MVDQPSNQIEFLRRLRTVRDFRADPVPDDALADVLEVGRWSGSASNRQPAEIVVVRDPGHRQTLTDYGANTAARAPVALVIVTPGDADRFEHEAYDEGRLSERLLLAAFARGLGSGVTWLKGEGPTVAKQMLGIPPERRVRTVIAIGYVDAEAIRARPRNQQPRKQIAEFAHWDRF